MRWPWLTHDPDDRRRRRRLGIWLLFGGLLLSVAIVRAIPPDWQIGPFRIDEGANALDPISSLYFADDPRAPFWLLVPTFSLPPRFFAARPGSSGRPVALAPSNTPTSSPSSSGSASPSSQPSGSPSGSPSPSSSPSGSPSPSASPSASPGPTPTPSPSATPTP